MPWRALLQCACLVVLLCASYARTMQAPFVLDDRRNISDNSHIRLERLTLAGLVEAGLESHAQQRPVANISLALNYYFHGYDVRGYHVVNLCVHVVTSLLIWRWVLLTLRLPWHRARAVPPDLAFWIALLWAVHPIQTQAVTYIVQRMTSLATLFYVLALVLYAQARLTPGHRWRWGLYAGCGLSGLLALGSKEIAVTLPVFLALYEWYFVQDLRWTWRWRTSAVVASLLLGLGGLVWLYLGANPWEMIVRDYQMRYFTHDFTLPERVMTQWRVVLYYLWLLLWPHPGQLTLDHDFTLSHGLLDPPVTLLALLALLAMAGLAVWAARRDRLLSFGLWWYLGQLVLESSVLNLELLFEHRLYLPSILLIWLGVRLVCRGLSRPWMRLGVLSAVALLWALWTYERNGVWASEEHLWRDSIAKAPTKARPQNNLGDVLVRQGRVAEALPHFREALRLNATFPEVHYNLGFALAHTGQLAEAVAHYRTVLRLSPTYAEAHYQLGVVLLQRGQLAEAAESLRAALRLHPADVEALNNLGLALTSQGQMVEGIGVLREALRLRPAYAEAHHNLGVALVRQGQLAEAEQHFREVQRLKPDDPVAYESLGAVFKRQGRPAEALTAYRAALRLRPQWPQVANNLAYLLVTQPAPTASDRAEAVQLAEAACLATDYKQPALLDTLAVAYAATDRPADALRIARQALAQALAAGDSALAAHLQDWVERYEREHPEAEGR